MSFMFYPVLIEPEKIVDIVFENIDRGQPPDRESIVPALHDLIVSSETDPDYPVSDSTPPHKWYVYDFGEIDEDHPNIDLFGFLSEVYVGYYISMIETQLRQACQKHMNSQFGHECTNTYYDDFSIEWHKEREEKVFGGLAVPYEHAMDDGNDENYYMGAAGIPEDWHEQSDLQYLAANIRNTFLHNLHVLRTWAARPQIFLLDDMRHVPLAPNNLFARQKDYDDTMQYHNYDEHSRERIINVLKRWELELVKNYKIAAYEKNNSINLKHRYFELNDDNPGTASGYQLTVRPEYAGLRVPLVRCDTQGTAPTFFSMPLERFFHMGVCAFVYTLLAISEPGTIQELREMRRPGDGKARKQRRRTKTNPPHPGSPHHGGGGREER